METIEVEKVILDDNKEYFIVDKIHTYVYFAKVDNPDEICIRKEVSDYYVGLDDEIDLNIALNLFKEKHKKSE